MNREIKFRAWDKACKLIHFMLEQSHKLPLPQPLHTYLENTERFDIMQFTGLQDKNGKDIFEGDIVSFETDPKGVVRWNNHVLCYTYYDDYKEDEITNSDFLWDWGQLKKEESKHYIVHGNIYENPELLNSQK